MVAHWPWGEDRYPRAQILHGPQSHQYSNKMSLLWPGFFHPGMKWAQGKEITIHCYKCMHMKFNFSFQDNICPLNALVQMNLLVLPTAFTLLFHLSVYLYFLLFYLSIHLFLTSDIFYHHSFWKRVEEMISICFELVRNHLY